MRVLILGGYGVFGGRLARLLLKDGVEVIIAGRDSRKAEAFAGRFGGTSVSVDITKDLSPILKAAPEITVDAVGPFQAYRQDPYRVPRFCIENGIHYCDLSDDADFTKGIARLNEAAIGAGCFAYPASQACLRFLRPP